MLYILTSSNNPQNLQNILGPVLKQHPVPHRVISCSGQADCMDMVTQDDTIFSMGKVAFEMAQKNGWIPKNRSITSLRGTVQYYRGIKTVITYDPAVQMSDHSLKIMCMLDAKAAVRVAETGSIDPPLGTYKWVAHFNNIVSYVEEQYAKTGKPVPLATDLETLGLDYMRPDGFIVSIFFTYESGQAEGIRFYGPEKPHPTLWKQIHWLLNSPKIKMAGANLKYDCNWMVTKWGIDCTNFAFDTTIVGSLIDENRSNSLNTHAKVYTTMGGYDDKFNADYDKSRMDLIPSFDLLPYAGGDTDATYRVREALIPQLVADGNLANFYVQLLHPASRAFEKLEQTGVLVDVAAYAELRSELVTTIAEAEQAMLDIMPNRLKLKHKADLRVTRPKVLEDFLFSGMGLNLNPKMITEKGGKPSVAMAHIHMLAEENEVCAAFAKHLEIHTSASKTLSTYVDGFLNHLRSDQRFHPSYMLFKGGYSDDADGGTVTGRLSAKDPAIQTVPKHTKWAKKLRSCIIPPEGYAIVEVDFSQGELRVAACLANEIAMIDAYNNNIDLHMKSGGSIHGYTVEQMIKLQTENNALYKEYRQHGKPVNFGYIYGQMPPSFMDFARLSYGVKMTLQEATNARNGFFETYPRLLDWHETSRRTAKKNGYIRSPLGRIRHLPLINSRDNSVRSKEERRAINSPVQATLSDLTLLALAIFRERYGDPIACRFFAMIHDATLAYVKLDELDFWCEVIQDIMEHLPLKERFNWEPQVTFVAEVEVGTENLAKMSPWHKAG